MGIFEAQQKGNNLDYHCFISDIYEVKHQRSFVKSYTWIQFYTEDTMWQFSITKNEGVSVYLLFNIKQTRFQLQYETWNKELEWVEGMNIV